MPVIGVEARVSYSPGAVTRFVCGLAVLGLAVLAPTATAATVPLGQYGIGTTGGLAGQLNAPQGVAVDAAGNVYVADSGNNRVSVFTSTGAFVRAFGWDVIPGGPTTFEVCTSTSTCKAGDFGGGAGQLNAPTSIALNAAGNLVVADTNSHRISTYTPAGSFLGAFGWDVVPGGATTLESCTDPCKIGLPGGGTGQLNFPDGVAMDAAGDLYIADFYNHRIDVFTAAGAFVRAFGFDVDTTGGAGFEVCTTTCKIGLAGPAGGQLNNPAGVAIGAAGNLLVPEFTNHRISTFTPAGAFVRAFGFDVDTTGGAGFEVCTVTCKVGLAGGGGGQLNNPDGVATDATGNVYVGDYGNHRISTFTAAGAFTGTFGFDVDTTGGAGFEVCTATCKVGLAGNGAGQLNNPVGVATDCRGALYTAEIGNQRAQRFGEPGTALPPCPAAGTPPSTPSTPPSNEFSFGKLKRDTKKGTAKLSVIVPGPGKVALSGKLAKPSAASPSAAGEVTLAVRAKGKAKQKLADAGKVKLALEVTFSPTGGTPKTKPTSVKLKRAG